MKGLVLTIWGGAALLLIVTAVGFTAIRHNWSLSWTLALMAVTGCILAVMVAASY